MKDVKKGNLRDTEFQKMTIYNNGEVAFLNNLKDLEHTTFTDTVIQMEVYVVVLLLEGKATVNLNGTVYTAQKNDMLVCTPNIIIENVLASIDFKCCCICMSPAYIQRIAPMSENLWDTKIHFEKKPIYTLHEEEAAVFCQYYDLLCSKIHLPSPVQGKVIDTLMLALLYDMQYMLNRVIQADPRAFSSGEYLFRRFVDLLENSYPRARRVDHYADKLHITPKYLSTVCKQCSGQTTSKLIDAYIVKDIEYLLTHTMKGIKEIAWELDFPNLSFFGKYVKKHLGVSPKVYREQMLQKVDDAV